MKDFNKQPITNEELFSLDMDVFIPAACENVITEKTADSINARVIVEAANGPTTREADKILRDKEVTVVPDILANAGGVIASYVEWRSAKSGSITQAQEVYDLIDDRISTVFEEVVETASRYQIPYKDSASLIAVREVIEATHDRGLI